MFVAIAIGAFSIACNSAVSETVTPTTSVTQLQPAPTAPIVPSDSPSKLLARALDDMQIESHWLKGVGVDWMTGEPNGKRVPPDDTHCSAFVAAAAYKLGVYILRPPEHKTLLLANAQNDWLYSHGAGQGWERVEDGVHAQKLANQGYLVVASYKNQNPKKNGHIAIVRPSDKDIAQVLSEGPQIIQAGGTNYNSTSLAQGFSAHPKAFPNNRIQFFTHAVDWKNLN